MQNSEFCMEKLWPDSVAERDFKGLGSDDIAIIDEVVSVEKKYGPQIGK